MGNFTSIENIMIPSTPGEIVDKLTILDIKKNKIKNAEKLKYVKIEYTQIMNSWYPVFFEWLSDNGTEAETYFNSIRDQIFDVNNELWDVEDALRVKEKYNEFDNDFIELARSVYILNDKRAMLKRKLNEMMGAKFLEVKDFTANIKK